MATVNLLDNVLDYFTGVIRADYIAGAVARGIFEKTYNVGKYTITPHYYDRTRTNAAKAVKAPNLPVGGGGIAPEALQFTKQPITMVMIYKDWMLNKNEVEGAKVSGVDLDLLMTTDIGLEMSKLEDQLLLNGDSGLGIDGFTNVSGTTTNSEVLDWDGASTTTSDVYNHLVDCVDDLQAATNEHEGPYTLLARSKFLSPLKKITDWGYNPMAKLREDLNINTIVTSNRLDVGTEKVYLIDPKKKNMALAQGRTLQTQEYFDNAFVNEQITYQTIGTFFFDPTAINVINIDGT